jgi:7-carboxy-7-deazaguanine synthase
MNAQSKAPQSRPLLITEIFHSLQGETSHSGLRYAFIRLTGCNLRCSYCDSVYAFKGGREKSISEILDEIRSYHVQHVLLTGGEPLLQRGVPDLITALREEGYQVSIETHGETLPGVLQSVSPFARLVMDIKTPSSRMSRGGYRRNLEALKAGDEIKFVIASPEDYVWAKQVIQEISPITREGVSILFSPVMRVPNSPGSYPGVELKWLAEEILKDRLPVRLQVQLHKLIWGAETTGV